MRLISALALSITVWAQAQVAKPIKWACIGNSITAGGYPNGLRNQLGSAYLVENDGVSGCTLIRKGDHPYWTEGKLNEVFKLQPDIISINLGTNDSKPVNWNTHSGEFEKDLTDLIDTLEKNISPKPRIFLVLPCPAFTDNTGPGEIRGAVIKNEIIPLIKKVATARKLDLIDVHTPMLAHPELFPDMVHPNSAGQDSLASIFFRTYLSKVTRIACIGNSITEYAGLPGKDAYTARLNMLYGRDYWVENDGKSGAYMQKVSLDPYWNTNQWPRVFRLQPNIVTIKLGTNDSRPQAWNKDKYQADYRSMIDSLSKISPKPRIALLLPCPSFKVNGAYQYENINDSIIVNHTIPAIKQVAMEKGLLFIDLHTPLMAKAVLLPDGVHPNAEGQDTLAHLIYRALIAAPVPIAASARPAPLYPETEVRGSILYVTYAGQVAGLVRLYTLDGSLMASATLRAGEASAVSLAGLKRGNYFLAVESTRGSAVKRVVLE